MNPFPFMIPIIALMIPIVAILVSHQQKMAQILHSSQGNNQSEELSALRAEVQNLKEALTHQTLMLDVLISDQRSASAEADLNQRMSQESR